MGVMSVAAASCCSEASVGASAPTPGKAASVLLLAMKMVLPSAFCRPVVVPKVSMPWPEVTITSQSSLASLAVRCAMRASSRPTAAEVSATARR
ncbi:hypothetical protein D3C71_1548120 [compost metagenome]